MTEESLVSPLHMACVKRDVMYLLNTYIEATYARVQLEIFHFVQNDRGGSPTLMSY